MQFFSGRLPLWACDRLFKLLCSPAECWGSACEGLSQLWAGGTVLTGSLADFGKLIAEELKSGARW